MAGRHWQSGLVSNHEEGRRRAISNDLINAKFILEDGCRERARLRNVYT